MDAANNGTRASTLNNETLKAVYGAAQVPEIWNEAIDLCAVETLACGGAFVTHHNTDSPTYHINAIGQAIREKAQQSPELINEYISKIAPLEKLAHLYISQSPSRRIWRRDDAWPEHAHVEANKHADWFRDHLDVGEMLMVSLNDNPRIFEAFVMHFPYGQSLSEIAIEKFKELLPHLAKASEMSVVYNTLLQRYSAILTVLNKVGIGIIVLDKNNNILVKNTEAERMLVADYGIKVSSTDKVVCTQPRNQAQLQAAIFTAQIQHKSTRAERILTLRANASSDPLIVEIAPLRDAMDELDFGHEGVIIQMIDASSKTHCSIDAFSSAYRLTVAESSVITHLLDGLSNREIAEERGTKMETVKSQIKHIMQKTNANSRIELVRRILKTIPPIEKTE